MKCRMCGKEASFRFRSYNIRLCNDCVEEFIKRRVRKAIREFKLLRRDEKLLVAVSGGKDSISLWDIMIALGYNVDAVHIDLGISGFSDRSWEKIRKFSQKRGIKLPIRLSIRDYFNGKGMEDIIKEDRRPACSLCGFIKRYIMNRVALEGGYVVLTGHNLDDETAALLGNLISWKDGYLNRQSPRLEGRDGFAPRAKPLILCSKEEIEAYIEVRKLPYLDERCPLSKNAQTTFYKRLIRELDRNSPGIKLKFFLGFLERRGRFRAKQQELRPCFQCGMPTSTGICNFCRLKKKLDLNFDS